MSEKHHDGFTEAPEIIREAASLLPFIPVLYIAWADCVLTPTEIASIRQRISDQGGLTKTEQELLGRWLDPASPPTPELLQAWLKIIRDGAGDLSDSSRKTLLQLGAEISRAGTGDDRCASPEVCSALADVEQVLGVVSTEATQKVLSEARLTSPSVTREPKKPSFPVALLQQVLDADEADMRKRVKALLSDPVFRYRDEIDKRTYREQVLVWCKYLAEQGLGALSYPRAQGGRDDLRQFIAAFETIAFHDLSLAIKFGVQFGLFGGSILNLGTSRHHEKYLKDVGSLNLPGCFAMTELGHGSNVKDIETTATFDPATDEFVIHTPTDSAHKDYIGNAALHGEMATVFAQLFIGEECHGVHAFLTPLRSREGRLLPGVRIADCGLKMGLNGVDNGRIWFDRVRIPRENLLNRFGDVSPAGKYTSPIASASKRFFTMLGTLVGGRVSIAAASLSAAKSALTIAVRYSERRRQFGPPGKQETLLMDYPSHQRRLLPLLARTYAFDFAQKPLVKLYAGGEASARPAEVLAAGLKALGSWHATETIQVCRESCGGKGYLAENRFAALKADTDVFATFEGDNTVLLQLVAKGCLTEFKHQFHEMNVLAVLKFAARQAATKIAELNPVVTRLTDTAHLRDPEFHLHAFMYREKRLLTTAASRIKRRLDDGGDSYQAFTECQNHLISLGKAYVQRRLVEEFQEGLKKIADESVRNIVSKVYSLFALSTLEQEKGWFLENGYIEGGKSKAIRNQVELLCAELRPEALALVDAFGIPDSCLSAPIALQSDANEEM